MPGDPFRQEVVTNIVVGISAFAIITGLLLFIILFFQKKRFQHQQELAEQRKEYSDQLHQSQLEIQEQTFNSISSEIHDNVGQILSLTKVQLNIIDQCDVLDRAMLSEAKENVSKALTDLRDIAKSLSSDKIRQTDLCNLVEQELNRIQRSGLLKGITQQAGESVEIKEDKKLMVFRIVQESLQNIIKHSEATKVEVSFHYEKKHLAITIADNGKGFDTTSLDQKDGLGLRNIMNRAKLAGGSATISSMPGQGTTITIHSPYE
jgi:two-component system, NarL family, sensor kinase